MCKIGILFENRDFEHDVYELIKAFYPEAEIHTLYENAEAEYDLRFSVERDNDSYIIKYERTENLLETGNRAKRGNFRRHTSQRECRLWNTGMLML